MHIDSQRVRRVKVGTEKANKLLSGNPTGKEKESETMKTVKAGEVVDVVKSGEIFDAVEDGGVVERVEQ